MRPTVVVVVGLLLTTTCYASSDANAKWKPTMSDAAIEKRCRAFFRNEVCSEALGRWLPIPRVMQSDRWTQPWTATHVYDRVREAAYTIERPNHSYYPRGTSFVYGEAGPSRGSVVYDSVHRLAFFSKGCCSYNTVVLASGVSAPPVPVTEHDLTGARLVSGVALGASVSQVLAMHGTTSLEHLPTAPGMGFLMYENTSPPKGGGCVQRQIFGFVAGRLSVIELYNGC